ncbi:PTS system fructose-specific transporter subunits IIABC [Enterobacter cancerogenus]|uniref:PTS system fructose-specific transporter subunits IIABC n=1 Tax=Enterobacter cancerogenus TaxID=69218 RepID=A0A484XVK5_9ENTR|nr:PTS system fructose-specific transporter subunits IIABC [Enterobacter cancerogenus]
MFSREEKTVGSTSLLLGLIGISEGAIPFILKNPRLIPVFMIGAVSGALLAIALEVKQTLPLPRHLGMAAGHERGRLSCERVRGRADLRVRRALRQP